MSGKVFEKDNKMAWSIGQNLYLDSKTADVKFVFENSDESVQALKAILSAGSPVFDAMFYGSLPENGDILIVDAYPEAFKQFLQFFYLARVRLTSDHIFEVANLCKKYAINEGLKLCETPMQMSLRINNTCTGYAVAILLGMENVVEFCEREIKHKATEILKSTDFLKCDHKLFDKILQLLTRDCGSMTTSASVIVDACMAWAKAKCARDNLDNTSANLKAQLKDSIDCIPFDELSSEQFSHHIETYKRFFVENELEAIILKKARKSEAKEMTTSTSRTLDCRDICINKSAKNLDTPIVDSFTSNSKLLLKEIYVKPFFVIEPFYATITLHNYESDEKLILGTIPIVRSNDVRFTLPFPIAIDQKIKYGIKFDCGVERSHWTLGPKHFFHLKSDVEIRFDAGRNIITRMIFEHLGA
ncbi:BTB/POZ domain-containing protein 1-like [Sitodiplosis mosellana]|uniref:BTB/POZ domain-containing protein 1-like n=1 Tax=Sitodiplosis mosellana TaxID=263140 RepID=UPI0024453300|nr:BTB/POZ domain-containing protein 1-like [Sitodiplosis mosellana]